MLCKTVIEFSIGRDAIYHLWCLCLRVIPISHPNLCLIHSVTYTNSAIQCRGVEHPTLQHYRAAWPTLLLHTCTLLDPQPNHSLTVMQRAMSVVISSCFFSVPSPVRSQLLYSQSKETTGQWRGESDVEEGGICWRSLSGYRLHHWWLLLRNPSPMAGDFCEETFNQRSGTLLLGLQGLSVSTVYVSMEMPCGPLWPIDRSALCSCG